MKAVLLFSLINSSIGAEPESIEQQALAVLSARCVKCHGSEKQESNFRLDARASLLKGGDYGPAVVPGKLESSRLIEAIEQTGDLQMPPDGKLPPAQIAALRAWVANGAVWPPGVSTLKAAAEKPHWAFLPIRKPKSPAIRRADRVATPIDAFITAKLEERGWEPAEPAAPHELLRRVYFDLVGLPPTPQELDAFLRDPSPQAFEQVVDRLLDSRHYGERWAQHWLDVVRYAETEGYEYDRHVPDAWRFRDYVIDSLNRDKPFDRFVIEQIAGDEIAQDDAECQTAAIFHRLGPVRRNAGNPEIALSRNEVLTERTDVIGAAFLGLTVGCARCHDHKLEPISQKDYYRLQAYLAATQEHNIVLAPPADKEAWDRVTNKLTEEIQALKKQARSAIGEEKERLSARIELLEEQLPASLPTIPSTRNDFANQTAIHVLDRGVWENKGEQVGPRPLSVLVSKDLPELSGCRQPRSQLANWLADEQNPLTARVIVNRLWQHHFGMGIVKTANDFGTRGDPPSHPELLDWLAVTLIENSWRLKPIHRLILLSNTYRQSSRPRLSTEESQQDPENRLLARFHRRRLSAEELRDAMLAVSGRLNTKAAGPSVMVPVDPELVNLLYKPTQWQISSDPREHDRRSVYLIAKRNLRLPFLEVFDAPVLQTSCSRREASTHAPQSLEMLNGRLANDLAKSFAERLGREAAGDPARMVDLAFRLCLSRAPTPRERELALEFLRDQPAQEFALAMFNLNGFLYVP